eukprot:450025_1
MSDASKLKINDKIDHRDEVGRVVYSAVIDKKGTNIKIHYDKWSHKWDTCIDLLFYEQTQHRIAKAGSISQRRAHRFTHLKKGDYINVNLPKHGWTHGEIKRFDRNSNSGQVQVEYKYENKTYCHWAHLDDPEEIAVRHNREQFTLLIDGFIRYLQQNVLIKDTIIPNELNEIIFQYCYIISMMKFYQKRYGYGLRFVDDKTVKQVNGELDWATCLLSHTPISSSDCNQFRVEYLWKSSVDRDGQFYIGFCGSIAVEEWNWVLGNEANKNMSVGIQIFNGYNFFQMHDVNRYQHKLKYRASDDFKVGDRFMLLFDFVSSECVIYHNDSEADTIKMEFNQIIPAVSLIFNGEEVQITKWESSFN